MAQHPDNMLNTLTDEKLDELVRRLVEALHPVRIYLFGSHARGTAGPESDVDIMIVHEAEQESYDVIRRAYAAIRDLRAPVELHVRDANRFERMGHAAGTVEHEVAATGRVGHER